MKHSTLTVICCPGCHNALSLMVESQDKEGAVNAGTLSCPQCRQTYAIREGIPQFIASEALWGPNRRATKFYDRLAPFYSLFTKIAFMPFGGERKARQEILRHLEIGKGRILEVSIGNGVNVPFLLESGDVDEIFGLDISAGQLTQCHRASSKRHWPVELFQGTAEALPFKSNSFETVFHIGGINFFSDQKRAIAEMIRVAQPGSKIVIADEAERLAKHIDRTRSDAVAVQADRGGESSLLKLVPDVMEDVHLEGIWKSHGKHHGYCLVFRKPA